MPVDPTDALRQDIERNKELDAIVAKARSMKPRRRYPRAKVALSTDMGMPSMADQAVKPMPRSASPTMSPATNVPLPQPGGMGTKAVSELGAPESGPDMMDPMPKSPMTAVPSTMGDTQIPGVPDMPSMPGSPVASLPRTPSTAVPSTLGDTSVPMPAGPAGPAGTETPVSTADPAAPPGAPAAQGPQNFGDFLQGGGQSIAKMLGLGQQYGQMPQWMQRYGMPIGGSLLALLVPFLLSRMFKGGEDYSAITPAKPANSWKLPEPPKVKAGGGKNVSQNKKPTGYAQMLDAANSLLG